MSDAQKGAISGSYYFFWGTGYMLGPLAIGAAASDAPSLAYFCLSVAFAAQSVAFFLAWGR
ncbi:MAG: hypothetical protein ACR2Q4_05580 [Geminicoccaceae bacterium]